MIQDHARTILSRSLHVSLAALGLAAASAPLNAHAADLAFDRIVIDADFPGGYQVEVADVNGDKKPDIIALGGNTCAWYENPTWTKRIITTGTQSPGVISSATADLDGDGKAEVAIAYEFEMNDPARGKLLLAIQGKTSDEPWTLVPVAEIPSIHRLHWGDVDGDTKLDLVVASIFGEKAKPPIYDDAAPVIAMQPEGNLTDGPWRRQPILKHKVLHAIEVRPLPATQGRSVVFTADDEGVALAGEGVITDGASFTLTVRQLVNGVGDATPKRGCSEIHLGRLGQDRYFLATIEPWHGSEVVIWHETEPETLNFSGRTVIDGTLDDGHALWVADIDGDGDDEVFAGHRGKDHRVSVFERNKSTGDWVRTVIDTEITAQDLRGGDLDGDGTPDVVAIGGASHNVVWYRPKRP